MKADDLAKLERNYMNVLLCNVTMEDRNSSNKLILPGLVSIRNCIQRSRNVVWTVERMNKCCWVKKCKEILIEGDVGEVGDFG